MFKEYEHLQKRKESPARARIIVETERRQAWKLRSHNAFKHLKNSFCYAKGPPMSPRADLAISQCPCAYQCSLDCESAQN